MSSEKNPIDSKDTTSPSRANALDLIRKSTTEEPPSFEELPDVITIGTPLPFMYEALETSRGMRESDIFSVAERLFALQNLHGAEFSCAIVADHGGRGKLGPILKGNKNSSPLRTPLARTQITTESGLIVYRDEIIAAGIHSHPNNTSFSLRDLYHHFSEEHAGIQQIYVIRGSRVIDLAHITRDSRLINEETFKKLSAIWNTYLTLDGRPRADLDTTEYNRFVQRILHDTLKIGYYTNYGSEDPTSLRKLKS